MQFTAVEKVCMGRREREPQGGKGGEVVRPCKQYSCVLHIFYHDTQQKRDGYFNLAKVISVAAE